MPSRDDIINFTDSYLEKTKFTDSIPIGLLVEGKAEVRKIATGVSACMELFERAAEWGADMVVVHHGMFWDNAERVVRGHMKQRVKYLFDRDMTLVGYHLPLDAHPEIGNNILFARAMGFQDPKPFGEYHGMTIGCQGTLEPVSIEEFLKKAEKFYAIESRGSGKTPGARVARDSSYVVRAEQNIRIFLGGKQTISSAAVISGGAWDLLVQAARAGIDCFVTGTADEPVYSLAREERINLLCFGHYATERPGIRRLGEVLAEKFAVEARFFDVANPL